MRSSWSARSPAVSRQYLTASTGISPTACLRREKRSCSTAATISPSTSSAAEGSCQKEQLMPSTFMGYTPIMSFTPKAAPLLLLALSLVCSGCPIGDLKPGHKGTYTCSCGMTGCSCSHCSGESLDCKCSATDAYTSSKVGDGRD